MEVWEDSVRATHGFLGESDVDALRPLVAEMLASDALEWCVLTSADDVVFGFMGRADERIEALFIDPAYFRRGAGSVLVAHAQRLAGETALVADVNEQNPAALEFYEALGFAVIGRSPTDAGGRPFPILHLRRTPPPVDGAA